MLERVNSRYILSLLYALLLIALVSSVTLSRYMTSVTGVGVGTGASLHMDTVDEQNTSTLTFNTDALKQPGDRQNFTFKVVNYTGDQVSDVTQNYTITVETTGNLPLQYTLNAGIPNTPPEPGFTDNDQPVGTKVTLTDFSTPWTPTAELLSKVVTGGILPYAMKADHTYTLTVTWPISTTPPAPDLSDEIDQIKLIIHAEQAMPQ